MGNMPRANKSKKRTTPKASAVDIQAALRLALNAAFWSGASEAISARGIDPSAPITNERDAVSTHYERKAWEYLATIPGDVGDAARRELDARSNVNGKTVH
jgi:hypothetical protein